MEKEKEVCDEELVEVRQRMEQYESGQVGLREAVLEIKQRKRELAERDRCDSSQRGGGNYSIGLSFVVK